MPFITKQYKFCAAHRYWNKKWTESKNRDVFGKDVDLHGHNYILEVTLKAPVNKDDGMAFNLAELKQIIKDHVIEVLDHKNLNLDVESFMKKRIPTAENIAIQSGKN